MVRRRWRACMRSRGCTISITFRWSSPQARTGPFLSFEVSLIIVVDNVAYGAV